MSNADQIRNGGGALYGMMKKLVGFTMDELRDIFGMSYHSDEQPYWYGLTDPVDLENSIGADGRGVIRISQEAIFLATKLLIIATDNSTDDGDPGDVLPLFGAASSGVLVKIEDDGNDVNWQNTPVHSMAMGTSEREPWYILPKPYLLQRNSNITFEFENATADPKRMYAYLGGWKQKDIGSLNLTYARG